MTTALRRYTSADLELLPLEDGKRYEIIGGELFVSKQPGYEHQFTCTKVTNRLGTWSDQSTRGEVLVAPGLIFAEDDDVAPDVVWVSNERLDAILRADGKLHAAPELVVEVLSPGRTNELRDRELKVALYSRQGVTEYWLMDWMLRRISVYRREGAALRLVATLEADDELESPLLPGFSCRVESFFPKRVRPSS